MEIGQYIDFHKNGDYYSDYTIRVSCDSLHRISLSDNTKNGKYLSLNIEGKSSKQIDITGPSEIRFQVQHSSWSAAKWICFGSWGYPLMICNDKDNSPNFDANNPVMFIDEEGGILCQEIIVKKITCNDLTCQNIRYYNLIPDDTLKTPPVILNTTITHNAPINEPLDSFQIGMPVFTTGNIYHYDSENKIYVAGSSSPTDCIPSVKSFGSYRQYLGICVAKHESDENKVNQPTIDFATHGDFYFRVNDSSQYQIGDIVTFDGSKLSDDLTITAKISQSIVGKITGIIDEHLLCVFKD